MPRGWSPTTIHQSLFTNCSGEGPGLLHHATDLVQPLLPETRVVKVNAERLEKNFGGRRVPRLQERQIPRDERGPFLLVHAVQTQNEQLAEDIAVTVKAGVDEVRDVGPPQAVARSQVDRFPVVPGIRLKPRLSEGIRGQPRGPPSPEDGLFESRQDVLPEHGRKGN